MCIYGGSSHSHILILQSFLFLPFLAICHGHVCTYAPLGMFSPSPWLYYCSVWVGMRETTAHSNDAFWNTIWNNHDQTVRIGANAAEVDGKLWWSRWWTWVEAKCNESEWSTIVSDSSYFLLRFVNVTLLIVLRRRCQGKVSRRP